jgi:hypothetical protein
MIREVMGQSDRTEVHMKTLDMLWMQAMIRQRLAGAETGIYSACTANEYVLEAVLEAGRENSCPVLIGATANQCNQGIVPKINCFEIF